MTLSTSPGSRQTFQLEYGRVSHLLGFAGCSLGTLSKIKSSNGVAGVLTGHDCAGLLGSDGCVAGGCWAGGVGEEGGHAGDAPERDPRRAAVHGERSRTPLPGAPLPAWAGDPILEL